MTTGHVGAGAGGARVREFRGQWWLPASPEKRVAGTLTVTPSSGGELHLIGGLGEEDSAGPTQVVLGEVDGVTPVTICSAFFGRRTSVDDAVVVSEQVACFGILVGEHLPDGEATEYSAVSVESAGLAPWVRKPEPRLERDFDGDRRLSIEVDVPDALHCSLPGLGELTLSWLVSSRDSDSEVSVTVRPNWHLAATEPLSEATAWKDFVTPLLFLITFATGTGDRLTQVRLYPREVDTEWPSRGAELLGTTWSDEPAPHDPAAFLRHLLRFDDVEQLFEPVMQAWFKLYARTHSALLDFFTVPLTSGLFAEDEFSRVARSLEVWHRASVERTYMPPDEFSELMNLLRSVTSKKQWQFIDMRLKYGNEPTFKQRLDEMIERAGAPLTDLVAGFSRFSRRVTDTRNALTHQAQLGDAFTDEEMFYAQKVLQVVFRAVLLRELGYDDAHVDEAVKRTKDWQWAGAATNPLRAAAPSAP